MWHKYTGNFSRGLSAKRTEMTFAIEAKDQVLWKQREEKCSTDCCLLVHADDGNHDAFSCFTECIMGAKEWMIHFSSSQASRAPEVTYEAVHTLRCPYRKGRREIKQVLGDLTGEEWQILLCIVPKATFKISSWVHSQTSLAGRSHKFSPGYGMCEEEIYVICRMWCDMSILCLLLFVPDSYPQ